MQNYHKVLLGIVGVLSVALLASCSDVLNGANPPDLPDRAMPEAIGDADRRWQEIERISAFDSSIHTGNVFSDVLAGFDRSLREFREIGIAFWTEFPEDERRYDWLLLTTAMPPSFALDPLEWATEELRLGPNTSPIDEDAVDGWTEFYAEARAEYLEHYAGNAYRQRTLRSTELRLRIHANRDARARGKPREDFHLVADELIRFVEDFPEPMPAEDREIYIWHIMSPIMLAIGRDEFLVSTREDKFNFVDELIATGGSYAVWRGEMIKREGRFRSGLWESQTNEKMNELCETDTCVDWVDVFDTIPDDYLYWGILHSVPNYIARNQPGLAVEHTIAVYEHIVGSLKIRALGSAYWDRMPLEDKLRWYSRASGATPLVTQSIVNFPTERFGRAALGDVRIGELSIQKSINDHFYRLGDELLSDERATTELKAKVNARKIHARMTMLQLLWSEMGGRKPLLSLMDLVSQTAKEYGDNESVEGIVAIVVARLASTDRTFGTTDAISDTERSAFFSELATSRSPRIREVANAALNPVRLLPGTKVEIQAPTMDGEPFDTKGMLGKLVLVDHWDTNCGPCIAAMPGIHDVYLRYKDRGFEVVSIAYDGESQRRMVQRYKDQMGLTWTTLNGEGLWGAVAAKYGYTGYPQYMLLDRQGRWVAGTAEMGNGTNLEALLKEMLAAEVAENEAATIH